MSLCCSTTIMRVLHCTCWVLGYLVERLKSQRRGSVPESTWALSVDVDNLC